MAELETSERFVSLKGGLTVPVEALDLVLSLEALGIPLATDGRHQLVRPTDDRLSPEDHALIQRWRHHLGALVDYRVPKGEERRLLRA